MAGSEAAAPNPYVGPRPFERGENLLGRDDEITDLFYLLSAERVVLLHSPSGAGKSSLINAGLLPRLRDRFDVWQPTRVNSKLPADVPATANRFLLSAMLGFEQGIPSAMRRTPQQIAGMSLLEHAQSLPRPEGVCANRLLVFDQFEEVLTTDPLAVEARYAFFDSLGDLLRDPTYWALIALREDYLAPLDPFARQVPTHMQNRFRIDLLAPQQAVEAISVPARNNGRSFDEDAVHKLVEDLSRVRMQQADGSFADQPGLNVEPMQLQVVCRQMWEKLPVDCKAIHLPDVEAFADVTKALAAYYATAVASVGGDDVCTQREVREWINDKLITPEGIRSQVLRGAGQSEGLQNAFIEKLVSKHLLRSEPRAGVVWYELAHDRLIEPVRTDNAEWRDKNLHPVQKSAALWDKQDRPSGMLLADQALVSALAWAHGQNSLTPDERDFLTSSTEAQAARAKALRQAKRNRQLTFISTIGFLLAIATALYALVMAVRVRASRDQIETQNEALANTTRSANWSRWLADGNRILAESREAEAQREQREAEAQKAQAQQQREIALAGKLMAEAREQRAQTPYLLPFTTLLAMEAEKRSKSTDSDEFLRDSLSLIRSPITPPMPQQGAIRMLGLSPDARFVAMVRKDGSVHVSSTQTGKEIFAMQHDSRAWFAAWSPNGKLIATLSPTAAALWNADNGQPVGEVLRAAPRSAFSRLAFSADSSYLAINDSKTVNVWKVNGAASPVFRTPAEGVSLISSPVFTADSRYLIAARDGKLTAWSVGDWKQVTAVNFREASQTPVLFADATPLSVMRAEEKRPALATSPNGQFVAAGYNVFRLAGSLDRLKELGEPITHETTFSADGTVMATPTASGVRFRFGDFWTEQTELSQKEITSITFSPQAGYAATTGRDGTARIWHLAGALQSESLFTRALSEEEKKPRELGQANHGEELLKAAFSPDGKELATVTQDFAVQRWHVDPNEESLLSYRAGDAFAFPHQSNKVFTLGPAVSTDGTMIARGNGDRILVSRSTDGLRPELSRAFTPPAGRVFSKLDLDDTGSTLVTVLADPAPPSQLAANVAQSDKPRSGKTLGIALWDTRNGRMLSTWPTSDAAESFLFSPHGKFLVVTRSVGTTLTLNVQDLHTGKLIFSTSSQIARDAFLFSADGKYFAVIDPEQHLHVWDTATWKNPATPAMNDSVTSLVSGASSDSLAAVFALTTSGDSGVPESVVRVWRAPDWSLTHELRRPAVSRVSQNTAIALSPDGDTLVTADWSRSIFHHWRKLSFWARGRNNLQNDVLLQEEVTGLAFNASGRDLVMISPTRLRVWDVPLKQQAASVETPPRTEIALFSPDGHYIVSLDGEADAAVWRWESEQVSANLCKHLSVNLSRQEWEQYLHGEGYLKTCPDLPEGTGLSEGILSADQNVPLRPAERKRVAHRPAQVGGTR